jgi:CRP-like cAMP-binding protein
MIDLLSDTYAPLRASLRQLSPFTDEELLTLAAGLRCRNLARRALFLPAGRVCRAVGYVLSGAVRYYYVQDGQEVTNYFCLENDWVGSYTSFLRQEPSLVAIEALEQTDLVTFSFGQLHAWEQSPDLAFRINHFLRRLAEYYIGCYDDRVVSFVLQSPEERYRRLMERSDLMQRVPQQYLATYLGITPVSLSRIRKRIAEKSEGA